MTVEFPSLNGTIDYENLRPNLHEYFINFVIFLQAVPFLLVNHLISTVEHFILGCIIYLALCVILYLCVACGLVSFSREMRNAKRVLFIIAHPDDEVMFFGPTILHYIKVPKCEVYLMCLSSGKNYGMDKVRTQELYESCKILGIKFENVFVHNHSNLPDEMDVRWPLEIISKNIEYVVEVYGITNIVTFDRYGISGHQNHCSIYYAVASLIVDDLLPKNCGVYVLESVNIIRKYWLFLDLPVSFIMSRFRYMEGFGQRKQLHRALLRHQSQIVWFRKLYMYFSRYMLINTLQQMNLVDIELDLELDD